MKIIKLIALVLLVSLAISCGTTISGRVYNNGETISGSVSIDSIGDSILKAISPEKAEKAEEKTPSSSSASSATTAQAQAPQQTAPEQKAAPEPAASPASTDTSLDFDVKSALDRLDQAVKSKEPMTPVDEYYLGRAVAANVLAQYTVLDNPTLTAYLNKICTVITAYSPIPDIFNGYHVVVLDTLEINAFATPGGHIFVSYGLISAAQSEDALAAVLAHEIAHIQLKHAVQIINATSWQAELWQIADEAAAQAAAAAGITDEYTQFSKALHDVWLTISENGYSQVQEFEADKMALGLLALAGYYPSSMIDVLQVLEESQPRHPGGFNKTHPSPAVRISNVKLSIDRYAVVQDTRAYRQERFRALAEH
ncbi:MAG: M48 family metalloprotease [Spirochaetaceae bacterium]|jgi:predicted Zn-dependent protease|nr:M48 family metalloprotease [Spirochaetaceae bacterium]